MTAICHKTLLETLRYDPLTGLFTWKVRAARRVQIGDVAGSLAQHGYVTIRTQGKLHYAHLLAWFYVTGVWPTHQVDHKNRVRSDNRFDNLRAANNTQNAQNTRKHADNSTGFKGVRVCRKRFAARIRVNGVDSHLGSFDTPEQAAEAYDAAAITSFGQFAQTNRSLGLLP